jgi:hypothetical protein
MASRPSRADIAEQDRLNQRRQQEFRVAADAVAAAFLAFEEVEAVALFGSVARPLCREVPHFQPYRRLAIEILHTCKDVDLAVTLRHLQRLRALARARGQALGRLFREAGIGVAHHQVDVFLFAAENGHYLGRLCTFAQCPKGRAECRVPGCGATAFLKQHEDFTLASDALGPGRAVCLFDRRSGASAKARDLPPAV